MKKSVILLPKDFIPKLVKKIEKRWEKRVKKELMKVNNHETTKKESNK